METSGSKDLERHEDDLTLWKGYVNIDPERFDVFSGVTVKSASFGKLHCAFLTNQGQLFTLGNNQCGQLGHGDTQHVIDQPRLVQALADVQLNAVSCGGRHTAAVSIDGELYCWGDSSSGQCGTGDFAVYASPQSVSVTSDDTAEQGHPVQSVACGDKHTLAISDEGQLWSWGTGLQLGLSRNVCISRPEPVAFLQGRQVLMAAAGHEHSIAIVEKIGAKFKKHRNTSRRVIAHVDRPSVCSECNGDIYTITEKKDMYIVDNDHQCPLGLQVSRSHSGSQQSLDKKSFSQQNFSNKTNDKIKENISVGHVNDKDKDAKIEAASVFTSNYPSNDGGDAVGKTSIDSGLDGNINNPTISFDGASLDGDEQGDPFDAPDNDVEAENKRKNVSGEDTAAMTIPAPYKADCKVQKSRSSFFDEVQAIEYLDRQLYGSNTDMTKSQTSETEEATGTAEANQFVQKVENILQYVPAPPAAVQQYVSLFTKNIVSNVKTSWDKFGFVSPQEAMVYDIISQSNSQDSVSSKDSSPDSSRADASVGSQGSMSKSQSMGSFVVNSASKTKDLERKASLPASACYHQFGNNKNIEPIILDTEVWTWGCGTKGQLGHGDILDRPTPCCVMMLNDKRVIKVVSGANHCVVLTADSRVYSWGDNSMGQLGIAMGSKRDEDASDACLSPRLISACLSPTWDIAAGDAHTLICQSDCNAQPQVYYCGLHTGVQEEGKAVQFTSALTKLTKISEVDTKPSDESTEGGSSAVSVKPTVKHVIAGGGMCGCIIDYSLSSYKSTLHSIATSERIFCQKLSSCISDILQPLLCSYGYKVLEETMYGDVLRLLMAAFQQLSDNVCLNSLGITQVIQSSADPIMIPLVSESDLYITSFQHYAKCFGDALALGAFDQLVKSAEIFLKGLEEEIGGVFELRLEKPTLVGKVCCLLQQPIIRMKEYSKQMTRLAHHYPQFSPDHNTLVSLAKSWDALKQNAYTDHQQAQLTRSFWDVCPGRFADVLKAPGRRLVRESKGHPLALPNASRFTIHRFILFNDVFVHGQNSMHQSFPLSTVWVEGVTDTDSVKNAFLLTLPEENLTLTAPSPEEKNEWMQAFNQSIDRMISDSKKLTTSPIRSSACVTPPITRHAMHIFYKTPELKDARYVGMWNKGKMHGRGELTWPDGRIYGGKFRQGQQHGHGVLTIPKEDGVDVLDGQWKDGKMTGLGTIRYGTGDMYKGYFREGKKHGHGLLTKGSLAQSSVASLYIGEWNTDKKHGYGVFDDVLKGLKYIGTWADDERSGSGVIVTLDGIYFEGNFSRDKMTGQGLLLTDDNSSYEGEFSGSTALSGKGVMTLPNGDYIEGHFNGTFSEGVKVNGMFHKSTEPVTERKTFTHALGLIPSSYGKLCVPADRKWLDIYHQCYTMLGCSNTDLSQCDSAKAWEMVAVIVSAGRKATYDLLSYSVVDWDTLEKIPPHGRKQLLLEDYLSIREYLYKAFDTYLHPLGKLLESLVDVYRATYVGIGAHCRLLHHAVQEAKSYVNKIYPVCRLLFPELPLGVEPIEIYSRHKPSQSSTDGGERHEPVESIVVSASTLLHPIILPRLYPPLFTLYAMYNEKEDDLYWRRILLWNKQQDLPLLASLGVQRMFWQIEDDFFLSESSKGNAPVNGVCYKEAFETLQHISSALSPAEKLEVIYTSFDHINKIVQSLVGEEFLWSMDDLFPVFLFVVVRARICHLGAEIHFIDDLMDTHLQFGELGIMFTTLKACYFQIQNEKIM